MSFFDWFRKADKSRLSKEISDSPLLQEILSESMEKTTKNIDKGEYYFQKGIQSAQFKDHDGAINNFNKSLEYADYMSMVYLNRGAVLQIQERFLDAREDYLKALEIENSDPSEHYDEVVNAAKSNLAVITTYCSINDEQGETVRDQIKNDGIDYAAKRFGEIICDMMGNDVNLIHQFVLEELEELDELGNEKLEFALQSGVERKEYLGAVGSKNHQPIHDQINSFFKSILCCLSRNPIQMFEFRASLLRQTMEKYRIGNH